MKKQSDGLLDRQEQPIKLFYSTGCWATGCRFAGCIRI